MNIEEYYPDTPIRDIEYTEDAIIIHTAPPEKETTTIHDLPILGKGVIIKVSSDADYPWMDKNNPLYTARLSEYMHACVKTIPDGLSFEKVLALDNVRCTPDEPFEIFHTQKGLAENLPLPVTPPARGAKSKINYENLLPEISNVLRNGIPDTPDTDSPAEKGLSIYDFIGDSDSGNAAIPRHPVSSYRELREYLLSAVDGLDTLSLETLHKIMHTFFPYFRFPSSKSANVSDYRKTYDDYLQMKFEDVGISPETRFQAYRQMELKPVKIALSGRTYEQRLQKIKDKESATVTIPARDFKESFTEWRANAVCFCRLVPAIQIINKTVRFLLMTYDPKQKQFLPVEPYTVTLTNTGYLNLLYKETKFLYLGELSYGLWKYTRYSALKNMEIPDSGKIEIGIGDCIRFSTDTDNYLIPTLEVIEHTI